jgi:hypothetical protein
MYIADCRVLFHCRLEHHPVRIDFVGDITRPIQMYGSPRLRTFYHRRLAVDRCLHLFFGTIHRTSGAQRPHNASSRHRSPSRRRHSQVLDGIVSVDKFNACRPRQRQQSRANDDKCLNRLENWPPVRQCHLQAADREGINDVVIIFIPSIARLSHRGLGVGGVSDGVKCRPARHHSGNNNRRVSHHDAPNDDCHHCQGILRVPVVARWCRCRVLVVVTVVVDVCGRRGSQFGPTDSGPNCI